MKDLAWSRDLWFRDGSVVLRAEDTLFRVYQGILSSQSSVFKILFTLPQPPGDDAFEGCPVVELQDSAFDLVHFLRVLLDWSYFTEVSNDVSALLSILRLSTKYDVLKLRERAISALARHFPSDPLQHSSFRLTQLFPLLSPSPASATHAIAAANIARETNALSLLPPALFACCSLPPDHFSGSQDRHNHDQAQSLLSQNQYTVLKARNDIMLFTRRHVFGFAFSPKGLSDCRSSFECRRARSVWAEHAEKEHPDGWINPLSPGTFISQLARVLCVRCLDEAKRSFEKGREELWRGLPGMLDLPEWEQLEKMSHLTD